jgi:hypothetical protein
MQGEILAANPASKIRIFAVNALGEEGGNSLAVAGRTLPLLQDDATAAAWTNWDVTWRDVVILDGENNALGRFNLTEHNLSVQSEYDALLDILRVAAGE